MSDRHSFSLDNFYVGLDNVRCPTVILSTDIYTHTDIMKTIQCIHPLHHHNGFVATWRLWAASGRVHALLVLEPTECSTSSRLGA